MPTKAKKQPIVAAEPQPYFAALFAAMETTPSSYVAFDFETTGLSPTSPDSLIAQIGYCQVVDGQVTDTQSLFVNWFIDAKPHQIDWLRNRIAHIRNKMAERGATYAITEELLYERGVAPKVAMELFFEYLRASVRAGDYILGFNSWAYDIPLFERQLLDTLNIRTMVPRRHVIDVCLLELARRVSHPIWKAPLDVPAWFDEVGRRKGQAQWSLHKTTGPFYLPDISQEEAHDAEYDSIITHRVFEQMKARATGTNTNADPATKPKESKHEPDQPGFLF